MKKKYAIKSKYQAGGKKSPVFVPSGTFSTQNNPDENPSLANMDAESFANITPEGKDLMKKYRKEGYKPEFDGQVLRFSKGTGVYEDNPIVEGANIAATAVTGVANFVNNNRLKNDERVQVLQSQQPHYWENMEAEGLNNIPAYTQAGGRGGKYGVKGKKKQTGGATPQPRRLTPQELQQWNMFLDYVKTEGYEGSADLNNKSKNLGASLFAKFKKANPNVTINYDIVPSVQTEMQYMKQEAQAFDARHGKPNSEVMAGISPVDGWFGSKTSSYRFPNLIVKNQNGQTIEDKGLMNGDMTPQGVAGSGAAGETTRIVKGGQPAASTGLEGIRLPKGAKPFQVDGGEWMIDDPDNPGDVIPVSRFKTKMQAGGGGVQQINGLPEGMEGMADVNAEEGEIVERGTGRIQKISDDAGTHEEGGVNVSNVKRVLEDTSDKRKDRASKNLLLSPDDVEKLIGLRPKRSMTHAKAYEFAIENRNKKAQKIQKGLKAANDQGNLTKYSAASTKLNFENMQSLPQDQDLFDVIYDHQEGVKSALGINDDGSMAKNGGRVKMYQAGGGIQPYKGGTQKTPKGNSNAFAFQGGLESFKAAWKPILDLDQYNNVADAQAAVYDYLATNQPDVAQSAWNEGITAKGKDMLNPKSKSYNKDFATAYGQVFDSNGLLKDGVKMTPEQLKALSPAYADNMLGIRSIVPSQMTTDIPEEYPQIKQVVPEGTPPPIIPNSDVNINPRFTKQPENKFHEATYWDELAPGMMGLADSMLRDPELYNSAEFHQLRLKQLDPTAAMNANQAYFNAVEASLNDSGMEGSGVANANKASLLGSKYKVNNQVQGNYDNQNVGIKNNEIAYNTQVRDKQSMADAETRGRYYRDVQQGRENQRQQKLKSVEDLTRVAQLKRRQNRSGNLIMKLSPAYDQNGEYNGYQYVPVLPPELAVGETTGNPVVSQRTPTKSAKKTTTTTFKTADGRVIKTVEK